MAGLSFADVLDDALAAHDAPRGARRTGSFEATGPAGPRAFTRPPDPFLLFSRPSSAPSFARSSARSSAPSSAPSSSDAAPTPAAGPSRAPAPEESRRWVRTLTRVQHRALDALNALGARLSPDFGMRELRREYRRLAYRLHPDRYHDRSAVERERLSRTFGEATSHYRDLLAAVDEPH